MHSHDWYIVFRGKWNYLEACTSCSDLRTWLWDFTLRDFTPHPGNLVAAYQSDKIFIICGNDEEFKGALEILRANSYDTDKVFRLTHSSQINDILNPVIFLCGNWWEDEVIQDPLITIALNGWL